ncbi:alkaline phosphatase D family protein [Colwellia sp. E2M01]|uniref:alkaline phosphatase D family protein n=1 Tax=Colwellia sp. E2M01 TaxID=2841561 RepID=UPI001C092713|nr:alkaline phosphatase D family protein [Colwellia sp. E2M01]MBU2871599.1 alkaline phosphatase D family protein [Colwellia sp. E2M01]
MDKNISRRSALKFVAAGVAATGISSCVSSPKEQNTSTIRTGIEPVKDNWSNTHDRVWLGGEFWANPMEDWRVNNGRAECLSRGGNRSIHSLTHQLVDFTKPFEVSVDVKRLEQTKQDGGAGIRLGARSELNEVKSNCFVQEGYDMGIINNSLILGIEKVELSEKITNENITLLLKASPKLGAISLTLTATNSQTGKQLAELKHIAPAEDLKGNIALVSNFAIKSIDGRNIPADLLGARYSFSQWQMQGEAFSVNEEEKFGPILWTMYSLSDSRSAEGFVMKLSAYVGPIGLKDNQNVELQIQKDGKWQTIGSEAINHDGWIATFRVANWDESQDTPFRAVYREKHIDGTESIDTWSGSVKANPSNKKLQMAALTCQNDYGFPYAPVANNVEKLNPDIVFFSGDQIYESHGGFGIVRTPAEDSILNYLRKFYQFGWAFRQTMRNQPTICLPDDHDVLQGNLWGEGGAKMQNIEKDPTAAILGGYIEPTRVINTVHRTTVAHHPDPYDPTPTNGISSYYGEMIYGDVGFAILADRQWKSGPERINIEVGVTGQDEDKFSYNPKFNPPGLELLGKRQEDFLTQWGKNWDGHSLKAVLSQTVFAGICTHQPTPTRFMKYDFDSSGWPASARNRAVDCMRESMALHICGDTHLGSLSQYGVDKQRDSNWAFCTPAISAGWPRWWNPDSINMPFANRPRHDLANTGEFNDTFGNKMYIYAVGNPVVGKSGNRYVKAHEKGSGFGVITFDTQNLTYTMEAYRFLVDVTEQNRSNQFPGWPVTIHQQENRGENILG